MIRMHCPTDVKNFMSTLTVHQTNTYSKIITFSVIKENFKFQVSSSIQKRKGWPARRLRSIIPNPHEIQNLIYFRFDDLLSCNLLFLFYHKGLKNWENTCKNIIKKKTTKNSQIKMEMFHTMYFVGAELGGQLFDLVHL